MSHLSDSCPDDYPLSCGLPAESNRQPIQRDESIPHYYTTPALFVWLQIMSTTDTLRSGASRVGSILLGLSLVSGLLHANSLPRSMAPIERDITLAPDLIRPISTELLLSRQYGAAIKVAHLVGTLTETTSRISHASYRTLTQRSTDEAKLKHLLVKVAQISEIFWSGGSESSLVAAIDVEKRIRAAKWVCGLTDDLAERSVN